MTFPGQDYWSRLPFSPPGDLPLSRMESMTPASSGLAGRFFTTRPPRKSIWPYLPRDNVQSHRLRMQDRSPLTSLQISITSPGCYLYFWLSINQRFPWSTPWVQLGCWNGSQNSRKLLTQEIPDLLPKILKDRNQQPDDEIQRARSQPKACLSLWSLGFGMIVHGWGFPNLKALIIPFFWGFMEASLDWLNHGLQPAVLLVFSLT